MLYINPTLKQLKARSHGRQSTGSVRATLTPSEKNKVLEVFVKHSNFYQEYPELFYQHNDKIGNDNQSYTTAKIIHDINIKIPDWMQKKNDLYESYLLRHNHIVRQTAEKICKSHDTRVADEYIDQYYIDYGEPAPRHTPSTIGDLWEGL
tara:strand:- start:767 stop:1216 length:450 start_codon:yes stop_codon:yes gene_type:complete